jgi:hypothetical protein
MKIKNIIMLDYEYYFRLPKCPEDEIIKYLSTKLSVSNTDIWCKGLMDNSYKQDTLYDIFNGSNTFYVNETIQELLTSNDKVKIDLSINIINSLYKL